MAHYKGAAKEAGRAATLMKKRVKEQEEAEAKKKKIEEELAIGSIHNKFATHYDAIEQSLKTSTIGNFFVIFLKIYAVMVTDYRPAIHSDFFLEFSEIQIT